MTDLHEVLDSVAGHSPAPSPEVVAADLRRGRRALLHRHWARGSAVALAGAAAVVALAVVPGYVGGDGEVQVVTPASGQPVDPPNPGVDLVRYDAGAHPKPLSPGEVPAGWAVGGTAYALVVSPPALDDTSPDDFRGKLVVYLDSGVPNEPLPRAVKVAVGDRTGYAIRADDAALQVWVPQDDGTALRAQAPHSLGWDEATLGRFLDGVTVGTGAQASVG